MRAFPAALERLTEQFARLPGIGMKSAQRLAFYVLSLPKEDADSFAQAIVDAKNSVRLCPVCQNLTDQELCGVCADPERDHSLICVVAEPKDVIAMERAREYHGVYHVLHGVISPLSHVGPDDLRIRELLSRVSQGGVREVIMATNPDTEGEATAMYLSRLLRPMGVKVTRLAYGIPVEDTIMSCNRLLDFQLVAKAGSKYGDALHEVDSQMEVVQKVNRVYATEDHRCGTLYKIHLGTGNPVKIAGLPAKCVVDNDNHLTIDVVDRDWYIRLARRYVRDFLGEKPPKRNTRRVNSIKKKLLEMLEV